MNFENSKVYFFSSKFRALWNASAYLALLL